MEDILIHTINFMHTKDITQNMRINKKFNIICSSEILWEKLLLDIDIRTININLTYYENYKQNYRMLKLFKLLKTITFIPSL